MSSNLRIVAWNCRRASRTSGAWDYLLELDPDVALLQEVGAVPERVEDVYAIASATPVARAGNPQRFRTAVLVKGTIGAEVALPAPTEWVARARVLLRQLRRKTGDAARRA